VYLSSRGVKNPPGEAGKRLGQDEDWCAYWSPVKEPFGVVGIHIDATVAHGNTKVIVPVGAVKAVSSEKVHSPEDVWEIVCDAVGHLRGFKLGLN